MSVSEASVGALLGASGGSIRRQMVFYQLWSGGCWRILGEGV